MVGLVLGMGQRVDPLAIDLDTVQGIVPAVMAGACLVGSRISLTVDSVSVIVRDGRHTRRIPWAVIDEVLVTTPESGFLDGNSLAFYTRGQVIGVPASGYLSHERRRALVAAVRERTDAHGIPSVPTAISR